MPRAARRTPSSRPDGIRLAVSVVHASLEHARWPLAVGHVQGMPLRGAEGVLDRRLGGRLSDRLLVGAYPDVEGQAVFVPAPESSPPGGLVLGLGSAGEVTISKVTRAMTAAALQWALDQADAMAGSPDEPVPIGVSAALVGTNPLDGITLQDSLSALVDGVISAEQLIRSSVRLRSLVRVATLEIVELYQERARSASSLLQQLDTATLASPSVTLDVAPEVEEREGGLPGAPPTDYTSGGWWRIQILGVDAVTKPPAGYRDLEYTSLGRRATADRLVARIEADTIDGLVQSSVTSPRPDPQLGNTLFEPLGRVQRGQLVEVLPLLGDLRVRTVDGVDPDQRVELLLALTLLRLLDRTGDRVTLAQAVPLDHREGDVHVVRAGQVAAGPDERVVVEDVEDAGRRDEDVVLADRRLRVEPLAAAAVPAAVATGLVALAGVAVPVAAPAAPATAVAFLAAVVLVLAVPLVVPTVVTAVVAVAVAVLVVAGVVAGVTALRVAALVVALALSR